MKTIAIDFDGVIHEYRYGYGRDDGPMPGMEESIKKILGQGHKIIVHSARPEAEILAWAAMLMVRVLVREGIAGIEWQPGITYHPKPMAHFYVDDRALRFTNWRDIEKYLL